MADAKDEPSFIWFALHVASAMFGGGGLLWLLVTSNGGNGSIPLALAFVGICIGSCRAASRESA